MKFGKSCYERDNISIIADEKWSNIWLKDQN